MKCAYVPDGRDRRTFGKYYCAEGDFIHGQWKLVAQYPKEEGSDGHDVEVYESRFPARFFRIVALPTKDSVDDHRQGFALGTGSGDDMGVWAHETALLIRNGMVDIDNKDAP